MKTAEIKELVTADLLERIDAEKANLVKIKLNHATSPVENSSTLRKARKDIARMMTILRQRKNVK